MQAEREFTQLAQIKDERSKDQRLSYILRKRNQWEFIKCIAERDSYRREIEQLAQEHFPLSLELELLDLLNTTQP